MTHRPATRVFRGRRVATSAGIQPASIHVAAGRIQAVRPFEDVPPETPVVEAGNALVFPGLVDTHVHVNEPGRTEWEGFGTATRAAAAGGVTTLLDMPLNSLPPTVTPAALDLKRTAAREQAAVDVGFLGGVVPDNLAHLAGLQAEGVFGFKCFLCPSGVPEFPELATPQLVDALRVVAGLDGLLMAHAELPLPAPPPDDEDDDHDPRHYQTWLATRPVEMETRAVALLLRLARKTGARVHVVHVSSPEAAGMIEAARGAGTRVSGETCPHYLTFAAEEIPDGATEYKCAPPIRDRGRRDGLWDALDRGALEIVVSDHSPAPARLKGRGDGDFLRAWGGISSLQLRLSAVWTEAQARGHPVDRLLEWLCSGPARLAGLEGRKGAIRPGADADFVLWHPEREFIVDPGLLRHRHPLTPWLGRRLAGVVEATYLRGDPIYRRGESDASPRGRLLSRTEA